LYSTPDFKTSNKKRSATVIGSAAGDIPWDRYVMDLQTDHTRDQQSNGKVSLSFRWITAIHNQRIDRQ